MSDKRQPLHTHKSYVALLEDYEVIEAENAGLAERNKVLEEVYVAAKENIALQYRLATVEEINAADKKLEDAVKKAGEL